MLKTGLFLYFWLFTCSLLFAQSGVDFTVGEHGLNSLSFNGVSLLRSPDAGDLQPAKSLFRKVVDAFLNSAAKSAATRNEETGAIELPYPWGKVSCTYLKRGESTLGMRIQITNSTMETIPDVSLLLFKLTFQGVPEGVTLDAGMFGYGFKMLASPMGGDSLMAGPRFTVPIIQVNFTSGTLNFCSDDLESFVEIPNSTNPPALTSYRFLVGCRDIGALTTKTVNVSLRFGPSGLTVRDLSSDVLKRYAEKYPFQLKWTDHRPIGAIYLASSGIKVPTNPRRWIMNAGKIDITTEQGKADFRSTLLKLADQSIKVLKDVNAQGMITWDPEGQEFGGATYYGDPRLAPTLAPEMEKNEDDGLPVIDHYFAKFRAAGFKVGVCIRPQTISIIDGRPKQNEADDEHAAEVLKDKIAYATKRWGCTLFYVDSTYAGPRPLNPDVFRNVADAFPDVLLIPELESMRYFAYSAPLNAYVHRVTSTPAGARMVYPNAFSVLLGVTVERPEDHGPLVAAVRNGDILLFNAWYQNEGAKTVKTIYEEAKVQ